MSSETITIGVFDSGIGGLSIASEIKRLLPDSPIVYFADSAYNPYGELPESQLITRCIRVVTTLIEKGCELIVVACNTATVNCIKVLRERFSVSFVGVEPGLKPAVEAATTPKISVMATARTINSKHYQNVKTGFQSYSTIEDIPCIGLADYVESLNSASKFDSTILAPYVSKIIAQNTAYLVLGCTHYSLIKNEIVTALAKHHASVTIIDTSVAVAKQVRRLVTAESSGSSDAMLSVGAVKKAKSIDDTFITSGELSRFEQQLGHWWSTPDFVIEPSMCQGYLPSEQA